MFVLFNKTLNRFFKHPKIGIWWSNDREEAEKLLTTLKDYIAEAGMPSLAVDLVVQEIPEELIDK